MDKRKSLLNVAVSMGFQLATMIINIVVRRILVQTCGNEVNGLNALYLSIIGFLSVAELGVGTAITFCMYKPIVQGETEKVAALYQLFQRVYTLIGIIILAAGLVITPFIHLFAKDYAQIRVDLYSTFILMLISVVATYFFGAKTALFNAYKNNYVSTAINSGGIIFQRILQMGVLLKTHSFSGYLTCRIVSVAVQWIITELVARKKYAFLLSGKKTIDKDTRTEVIKNIKAMFMHKIGYLLVITFDGILISAFVGVVALGEYSNYTAIMDSMASVIQLVFTSLTSVCGHMYAKESKEVARQYCDLFHLLNFVLGIIFYLGYYAVIDNLIAILFAKDLVVPNFLSAVIAMNGFVQFMRQSTMAFRGATGTFYYDRWKPLVEGTVNIILSVLFVKWIGVAGVIMATTITSLLICHVVEPYVVYKNAFGSSAKKYWIENYAMILIFAVCLFALDLVMWDSQNQWLQMLINGCISLVISIPVSAAALLLQPDSRKKIGKLITKGKNGKRVR